MKTEKKYQELIDGIIDAVGGKDNITTYRHCVTRLRFNVKDKSLVDFERVKKFPGVLGVQWSGEQLQIIIGNDVSSVYALIGKKHDMVNDGMVTDTNAEKKKITPGSIISGILEAIIASVTPCIVMLGGSGMLRVIVLICTQFGFLPADNPTLVTLTWVADAAFYFLPVFVAAFAAKKFGANIGLGMLMGAVLIHPTFVSMVAEGDAGSIFGLPIYIATYSSSIIPAVFSVWILAQVEKFLNKYLPSILKVILGGALIVLIMTPLTLVVIAPLGAIIGEFITAGLLWLYDALGFLAIGLLAAFMPLIIMTGMHFSLFTVYLNNVATLGYDPLVGVAFFFSNIGQSAACLAVAFKSKNKERKALGFSASIQSLLAGVSEPGMYGITLKYKTPMIAAIIGCFIGGSICGLTGVSISAFLAPNIFASPAFIGQGSLSIIWFLTAFAATFVVTFIMCLILYKDMEEE